MKVIIKLKNGTEKGFEDVLFISETINGINVFGNEIIELNIVQSNYVKTSILVENIETVKIVRF